MPLTAAHPRRLYRLLADKLREEIEAGVFPVGTRLPGERELAARLGVSRPSLREALIALEVEGVIQIRLGSGIYVVDPRARIEISDAPPPGPFDVLKARQTIEAQIAAEAARSTDDFAAHIARLEEALAAMKQAMDEGTFPMHGDRMFHIAIAEMTGNPVLVRIVDELMQERSNPIFDRLSSHMERPHTWRAAYDEHVLVRDAILAHDPAAASEAMARHLSRAQIRFVRSFGGGSTEAGALPSEIAGTRGAAAAPAANPRAKREKTTPQEETP